VTSLRGQAIFPITSYTNATPSGSFSANPFFRGILIRENLKVVDIADFLAGVDADQDGSHWSLLTCACPTRIELANMAAVHCP
jgi:hypothetical protein